MTAAVLERMAALFVTSDAKPRRSRPAAPAVPGRAAVLASAADVLPIGSALANELRVRASARTALVLLWRADASGSARRGSGPGTPAARRLARRLSERGLEAAACGRLVLVALPAAPGEALRAAAHGWAASSVPTVVALGGPRPSEFDGLLSEQAVIVVAGPDDDGPLTQLAADGLRDLPADVVAVAAPASGPARWLACTGHGRLPGLAGAFPAMARA